MPVTKDLILSLEKKKKHEIIVGMTLAREVF